MCGIFGFQTYDLKLIKNLTKNFLHLSEERGKEASGFCLNINSNFNILKKPCSGSDLAKTNDFNSLFDKIKINEKNIYSLIGQCRLATDGKSFIEEYNHPAIHKNICLVHNGIILNTKKILNSQISNNNYSAKDDDFDKSDTLNFAKIIQNFNGDYKKNFDAINKVISGTYSISFFDTKYKSLYLASNNKSLYYFSNANIFLFASEKLTLIKILKYLKINDANNIKQFNPNQLIQVSNLKMNSGDIDKNSEISNFKLHNVSNNLTRCKKCILPNTYPYIKFDKNGICNFCLDYVNPSIDKKSKLNYLLDKYRKNDGSPDCLVGLSGGRDSCYGIHVLKEDYGMNPVAYTYDWGLTTDVSRRNQALMVGRLGIEHIIRSPRIDIKRDNIRKNIQAWLKKPDLGMVPLFMAGDKDFYKYGRTLKKQLEIDLTVFCSGQHYEQGNFFIGFCGVKEDMSSLTSRAYSYPYKVKFKLASYYILQYLKNPSYLNKSFFDSIMSFVTMFLAKDDFLYLFEYIDWDEVLIDKTLKDVYSWESDKMYGNNQWRMGDGQTAFTNYIYHKLAGFSEFDDFRSKQIRDKKISRDEALELTKLDNEPKYEVLEHFASLVGINLEHTLSKINTISKLY